MRLIEDLRESDTVQTKDNGLQPLRWIGKRRMTGARLFAMPKLRPIRISSGALGVDRPDEDLLVSPEHRMLIKGSVAQSLFNTSEVLVTAKDLINGTTITVDMQLREVTYIHVLLDEHQILMANGLESESFHPASAAFASLDQKDRKRLLVEYPELEYDPHTYGSFARRTLSLLRLQSCVTQPDTFGRRLRCRLKLTCFVSLNQRFDNAFGRIAGPVCITAQTGNLAPFRVNQNCDWQTEDTHLTGQ